MLGNAIRQTTTTTGTGNLTLSAVTGYPTFANVFAVNQPFWYTLMDAAGLMLETGIGYLSNSTTLVRTKITATLAGGYTDENPSAVSLSGTTTVICATQAAGTVTATPSIDGTSGSVNRFISPANRNLASTNVTLTSLRCIYSPFLLTVGERITQMAINVSTLASSSVIRLGVYTCKANGYIGDLLATTGDLDSSTTGLKTGTLASPIFLPPGMYYTACVANGAPAVTGWGSTLANMIGGSPLGFASGGITPIEYRHETLGSAVLPATASTSTTAVNVGVAHFPAVHMGVG